MGPNGYCATPFDSYSFMCGMSKAVMIMHESTHIPLAALQSLVDPHMMWTCSAPGCFQPSLANAFLCRTHHAESLNMNVDVLTSVRQFYLERLKAIIESRSQMVPTPP
jgi:hypothetical protein